MARRGNNEGSIYRQQNGLWRAAVSIGVGKRKYLSGQTRQEVAKKLTDVLKAKQDSTPIPSGRLTFARYAIDWLSSVRLARRPKTYESYESSLRIHIVPQLGHIQLNKLTPSDLERLYTSLTNNGAAPKSVRNYHACIHSMLDKAVRQGLLIRNVAGLVDLPRKVHRDLPMISYQQTQAFIRACRNYRLESLFILAITTGPRQGELLGLTWDNVDLETGEINIRQALQKIEGQPTLVEPKTSRSKRTVALTDIAVGSLRRHHVAQIKERMYLGAAWNNKFNLVFTTPTGTPLDKDNIRKRVLPPIYRAAELSTKLTFHDLRHIAASPVLGKGVSIPTVSDMVGHADAATTLRVYAHAIPGAQREAAIALNRALAE